MKRISIISLFLLFFIRLVNTDEADPVRSKIEISADYVQEPVVRKAFEYLGTPYRYGGINRDGVDCSGLAYAVYLEVAGKSLPRTAGGLWSGYAEAKGDLCPGDLVFFNTTGGVSHVGIAVGGKRFIHAASAGPETGVIVSSLDEAYYKTRYLGARRIFKYTLPALYVTLGANRLATRLYASLPEGGPLQLSVFHRRKNGQGVVCLATNAGAQAAYKARVEPGQDLFITWNLPSGDWVISFIEDKTGEIARIEAKVERGYGK